MLISIGLILTGFILVIKGADWLVKGATSLAKKNNISDLVIGLTIVSFGTSAPEMVVNSIASFQNHSDIVFGNIIGSNNFNLFVILGITGLIMPITVQSSTVWKEIPISFFAALLLLVFANNFFWQSNFIISRPEGLLFLSAFGLFLYYIYRAIITEDTKVELAIIEEKIQKSNLKIWGLIVFGLAGLIAGGKMVVNNAIVIATILGVSEKIIGLTIVAAGTSLPELVTSVVAVIKKNDDIAIGNIIGSNIFNILLILPVSALINPLVYNPAFNTDIYLLSGGTLLLFIAMFTWKRKKLDRFEAAVLLGVYILYTLYLIEKEIS